jgi:hypothetical protein
MRGWRSRGTAVAVASALAAAPLPAQTLRGKVLDAESGQPVTLAFVGLLAEGRTLVVSTLVDGSGGFALRAPAPGSYFLYVARTGYRPVVDGLFDLGAGGALEIRVGLSPSPMALEPVIVDAEAEESHLERVGFYDRAARGLGTFLLREDIRRTAVDKLTDALRSVPRVEVMTARPVIGPEAELNPEVLMNRGTEYCSPTLYIDGAVVQFGSPAGGRGRPVRPDDYVDPSDVEAIEVYTRLTEIPLGLDATGECGLVVIWTRMR